MLARESPPVLPRIFNVGESGSTAGAKWFVTLAVLRSPPRDAAMWKVPAFKTVSRPN